ncbi:CHAD domain-containing protein [Nonomuraea ferruginea]
MARRGVTLRRRRGGADPGWHLKLPKAKGVRQEIAIPLTRSTKVVPAELAELVRAYTRGAELGVVAELDTRRSVTLLKDGDRKLVEIADDRVKGTVYGTDPPSGDALARGRGGAAGGRREAAGQDRQAAQEGGRHAVARPPASWPSSSTRRPPPHAGLEPGTAGHTVMAYLSGQVTALLSQDPRVRREEEDAVHQMRVAARRLRSALKAFKPVVRNTSEIQDELRWLGGVLGEVRDLEVIRARFARELAGLPPELVVGPVRARLGDDLLRREREGYDTIRETLGGERYYALLDALDALVSEPELGKAAADPAETRLADVAAANWNRVTKAYETAQAIDDPEQREIAMHDVRKAAKRARYTAEALRDTLGKRMGTLAKLAEDVQEVLGAHQDGVVAQETLAEEAGGPRAGRARTPSPTASWPGWSEPPPTGRTRTSPASGRRPWLDVEKVL